MKKKYVKPQAEEISFCPEEELMGGIIEPGMGNETLPSLPWAPVNL